MTINYIHKKYLKYNKGKAVISAHIEALHAAPPVADLYTDKLVENIVEKIGCAGIISTVSRKYADLNRSPSVENIEAIIEYRETIKDILQYLTILDISSGEIVKPYLHLSIHGMKDAHYGPFAIEIGTLNGKSCSKEMKLWFERSIMNGLKEYLPGVNVIFDRKFIGDRSIAYHRLGDGQEYEGYKDHFQTFQMEISFTLRKNYSEELVHLISKIITDFQEEFILNYD